MNINKSTKSNLQTTICLIK
uniref:GM07660p n=1 Tax=Drosophila melanogaster TaxID=7227 RepID=Q8T3N1_DROME|nr:GM07660p [Drosophila melanogaster]